MILSEETIKKQLKKLSREELEDFVLGIATNPSLKPYLSLRKQVEACEKVEAISDIKPFTEQGSLQIEMVAKYYKTLKDLINSLDFFSEKLGLTKFLNDASASELKTTSSADKSDLTYEDMVGNKKAKP
jgi:hypothetical protein